MSESLKQRIITAILMGVPILLLLLISNMTRMIFVGLLATLLLYEYLSLFYRIKSQLHYFVFAAILAFGILYLSIRFPSLYPYMLGFSLLMSIILLMDLFMKKLRIHIKIPFISGVLYIILPLSLLLSANVKANFSIIILSVILLSWISDISAYFVGKSVGKHKLMPSISPGKTWEGFLGAGMIVLIFSYFLASYFSEFTFQVWVLIGLTVWIFGVGGDLVESQLKRQMQLKDSGTILPGHGGFLDRFDGFYFCLPFVLLILYLTT